MKNYRAQLKDLIIAAAVEADADGVTLAENAHADALAVRILEDYVPRKVYRSAMDRIATMGRALDKATGGNENGEVLLQQKHDGDDQGIQNPADQHVGN